jgi:hypothetical protein
MVEGVCDGRCKVCQGQHQDEDEEEAGGTAHLTPFLAILLLEAIRPRFVRKMLR